jgi:hypothetical protein
MSRGVGAWSLSRPVWSAVISRRFVFSFDSGIACSSVNEALDEVVEIETKAA